MHASSFIDNQTDEDYSFEVGETRSPFRALLHPEVKTSRRGTFAIACFSRNGEESDVVELFVEMLRSILLPDQYTLGSIVKACSGIGDVNLDKQFCMVGPGCGQRSYGCSICTHQNARDDAVPRSKFPKNRKDVLSDFGICTLQCLLKLPADKLPWNHLHKIFSLHDVELSEADLLNHGVQLPKTEFIDDEIEYEDDDMNEDEMVDNFYDPVCAISDNGGSLAVKASS
ncbi:hypothetical protein ACFE04_010655 [Oxalis oulophora]